MISVNEVEKSYGKVKAVKSISFNTGSPGNTVILGPSGCGKTTLLRMIAGLEKPDKGTIFIDGALVSNSEWTLPPDKRNIGFVFQTAALWPHMTIEQNIMFGLGNMGKEQAYKRKKEIMSIMGIDGLENRYPDEISGGQAKRVSIARTLAPKPKHLLLDEPLTNLNKELRGHLLSMILDFMKQSCGSLIYVTHDMHEAETINGNIIILED